MSKRQATTKIIAGTFKGTKIPFKPSKLLRPTENKTKETLFNWLLNDLNKKICLDMFAGTGSLGIEAISRGAEFVLFVEKDKRLWQASARPRASGQGVGEVGVPRVGRGGRSDEVVPARRRGGQPRGVCRGACGHGGGRAVLRR